MPSMAGERIGPQNWRDKYKIVQFSEEECLGSGAQARVFAGIGPDRRLSAIKVLRSGQPWQRAQLEIAIHARLHHKYIVRLKESFEYENQTCIVMEYANGGTLHEHIFQKWGCLPEISARPLFQRIYIALTYMHSKGIVHRDLKLKNILMHNGSVKLSDFGLSQVLMDDDQVRFACGTIDHMAPELFKSPDERHNGKAADVYSLGVLLYSILVGAPPILIPEKLSQSEQISFIQTKLDKTQIIIPEYSGPFHNNSKDDGCQMKFRLTDDVKHLLASMLNKNPQSRITMEGIKAHNWMHMHLPYIMYCQSACGLTTNLRGSC